MKKIAFSIGKYRIQENGRVFVIAEAGVNHNTELNIALQLIDIAVEAGADAVKFQTFKAEGVVTKEGKMAAYQVRNLGIKESQLEMVKKLELPIEHWPVISDYCKKKNIMFFSTPHGGKESVDLLETLNVPAYKIGSGDLTNYILLEKVAQTRKPIILSSGMATLSEVVKAVDFLHKKGCKKMVMLHCTTNYPTALEEVNMLAMKTMMEKLNIPVGYSDHTQGDLAAVASTLMGSAVYEFHITANKDLPGPDQKASANVQEASSRIANIRMAEAMTKKQKDLLIEKTKQIRVFKKLLGRKTKKPVDSELQYIPQVRRHLVVTHSLPSGHTITENDLEAKRPGNIGTPPDQYEVFLGKKIKHSLKADHPLTLSDLL